MKAGQDLNKRSILRQLTFAKARREVEATARKKWELASYDKQAALQLARQTQADAFAVLLLHTRGIDTPEKVEAFLHASEMPLSSPLTIRDMGKAVLRIRRAVEREEKILVYGDYDADGVTATALLYSYLESIGADVTWYIPSRIEDGYGLSPKTAEKVLKTGCRLVVTVDNGIASIEEAAFFKEPEIDFSVTDHHQVGDELPDAVAVVDPHRPDDTCPFKDLAGVGVALKLVCALEDGDTESVLEEYGDLAAIGTIADIVPLVGENRTIVQRGLEVLTNTNRQGLLSLMRAVGVTGEVSASSVAYAIAPKINAAGRMASAALALELLLTEDPDRAESLVEEITAANAARQSAETAMHREIEAMIKADPALAKDRVLVVAGRNWHPGVIGIVAARLVERYGRPAAVISIGDNGECKGSARSIEGFSLYEALSRVQETLIRFGGHTLAAGFSVAEDGIERFRRAINDYAGTLPSVFPTLHIDCRLNPQNIGPEILESLSMLEPFGAANPSPVFMLSGMRIDQIRAIGNNRHLRLRLSKGELNLTAVYFNMTPEIFAFSEGDTVDLAVRIEKNEYMGSVYVSIQVRDVRPAGTDDERLFGALAAFGRLERGETLSDPQMAQLLPSRRMIEAVYKWIRANAGRPLSAETLTFRLGVGIEPAGAAAVTLAALEELGLVEANGGVYGLPSVVRRAKLTDSTLLRRLGFIG